jgi:hypothetical protein
MKNGFDRYLGISDSERSNRGYVFERNWRFRFDARFVGYSYLGITNGRSAALYQASSLGIRGERRRHSMEPHTIGINLGKTSSHWVLNEKVNSAFAE